MSPIQLAAVLGVVVLVASMLSVELGITVALIELTLGVVVGNVFDLHSQAWLDFVAKFARRAIPRHATFTTLLMSTGLTFGTISSLYGLTSGIIDKTQFSLLITVVVLSAVVPIAIAERWFLPPREKGADHPIPAEEFV